AWKIAEGNVIARFRGRSQFIGLQIEYSLLERRVEQEMVPLALEFGLGITPLSPLKSGALSGKHTRADESEARAGRATSRRPYLNQSLYTLVGPLPELAGGHDTTVARVARAWVQAQLGVGSTIIGARRLDQLEDTVRAVDVKLTPQDLARLDALTNSTFGF